MLAEEKEGTNRGAWKGTAMGKKTRENERGG